MLVLLYRNLCFIILAFFAFPGPLFLNSYRPGAEAPDAGEYKHLFCLLYCLFRENKKDAAPVNQRRI